MTNSAHDCAHRPSGRPRPFTHIIYLLHGFSVLMGILGPALIITTFLHRLAFNHRCILNYLKRTEVRHTYLDSHSAGNTRHSGILALAGHSGNAFPQQCHRIIFAYILA